MRKLLGAVYSFLALGSAMFFTAFAVDLLTGGNPDTSRGVLAGLVVFFGGLGAVSGYAAKRAFTTKAAHKETESAPAPAPSVDIALEARMLKLAAASKGRVTVAEVAVGCAVTLEEAERALDGLAQRGHANLLITDDGERVYVLAGFLSEEQKEQAQEIIEATR
jgi:hypothetical protein